MFPNAYKHQKLRAREKYRTLQELYGSLRWHIIVLLNTSGAILKSGKYANTSFHLCPEDQLHRWPKHGQGNKPTHKLLVPENQSFLMADPTEGPSLHIRSIPTSGNITMAVIKFTRLTDADIWLQRYHFNYDDAATTTGQQKYAESFQSNV